MPATNYSTKTSISIYQFNNEDEYRQWLGSNKNRTNDIIAFVKNPVMNNGLDIFINGHSVTKTRFFLYSGGRSTEITSSNVFNPAKQYVIKSITRNGLGEKQMVTIEEIDIVGMQSSLRSEILSTASDMMDEKIVTYAEEHPVEIDPSVFHEEEYNRILTHNHYILRKIFSLIYKATDNPINMTAALLDENQEEFTSYSFLSGTNATISGVNVDIFGGEGYDIVYSQLLVIDSRGTILKRVDGRRLVSGKNTVMLDNELIVTRSSTITLKLGYSINNWPSAYKNSLPDNYDKVAEIGTLNKTGINDMVTKEINITFRSQEDDDPVVPGSVNTFFFISIPSRVASSSLQNWETVQYLTSTNIDSNIKIVKGTDISSLRLTPSEDSYLYVMLPYSMQGMVQVQPAGGFPDTLTQRINTGNYNGKLYALYKEDYAQDASITYKVVYDD